MSGAHAYFSLIVTVLGSVAVTDSMAELMKPQPVSAVLEFSSIENFTSAEVIGEPLEKVTPSRRVIV